MSFARAVRGSNWIEGYRASLDDVLDTIKGEEPLDATHRPELPLPAIKTPLRTCCNSPKPSPQ